MTGELAVSKLTVSYGAVIAVRDVFFEVDARAWPAHLSGGQRQRAAIALATRPSVIVADEPTSALDASVQAEIRELFRRIVSEVGVAMVVISHDITLVKLSERVIVLNSGGVVERGATAKVLHDPDHPCPQDLIAAVPRLP